MASPPINTMPIAKCMASVEVKRRWLNGDINFERNIVSLSKFRRSLFMWILLAGTMFLASIRLTSFTRKQLDEFKIYNKMESVVRLLDQISENVWTHNSTPGFASKLQDDEAVCVLKFKLEYVQMQ